MGLLSSILLELRPLLAPSCRQTLHLNWSQSTASRANKSWKGQSHFLGHSPGAYRRFTEQLFNPAGAPATTLDFLIIPMWPGRAKPFPGSTASDLEGRTISGVAAFRLAATTGQKLEGQSHFRGPLAKQVGICYPLVETSRGWAN